MSAVTSQDAGKLWPVRTSRTGLSRPVGFVAVVLVLVLAGCGSSEFRYVSNSSINTYLKVPADWTEFDQDDLVDAEVNAAREANQPSSLIDVLVNRSFQWRVAFDGDPQPSIQHTLGLAEEPVVEVSVRTLGPDEHDQVSLAALRNVLIDYDDLKQEAEDELARSGVGIAGQSTSSFRAIDEEELHFADGIRGVRLRYVLRPSSSPSFYAFDQTTLVDSKAQRLYVLLIRSGEEQFLHHNELFTEIAKSFTVKAKG